MLDVITFLTSFFNCVNDCSATLDGVLSDYSAFQIVFLNRFIIFKSDYIKRPVIDWKTFKNSRIKW